MANISRKQKASPVPPTPDKVLRERINQLEYELKLVRQNMGITTIHTFDREGYIDPTQGEIFWNWPNQRSYMYHHDRYRPTQPPTYHIKVFKDNRVVVPTTGEDRFFFNVSPDMDQFYLYFLRIYVSTSGSCTVMLVNVTQGLNMLTANATISSGLSATYYLDDGLFHATNSRVEDDDLIAIQVNSASGCKGLGCIIEFNPDLPA